MKSWRTVNLVNTHAEGEVGNVVVGGVVDVPGATAFDKMEFLRDQSDGLRRSLLFEPRGSVCRAVNVLLPTSNPKADMAFVIMEATKYPMMSGSNTMCVATAVLETGIRPMHEPETTLILEAPGGLVEARCACKDGRVERVHLRMLPSFVLDPKVPLSVPDYGKIEIAIAYGGIFFAIASADAVGVELKLDSAAEIVKAGIAIRVAANDAYPTIHPENDKVRGITNIILTDQFARRPDGVGELLSATVIGNGRLDRSPCGTGVSARMALLHKSGSIEKRERLVHRSIFGTYFEGFVSETTKVGTVDAVITEISGRAWITGFSQALIDPTDPLAEGHCPNDVWLTRG
ncbi:MAG: proline racemase family protein [Proteobacteria bacterium]|nr:proline racemase family protein [Pseudomonadota bacterium]